MRVPMDTTTSAGTEKYLMQDQVGSVCPSSSFFGFFGIVLFFYVYFFS